MYAISKQQCNVVSSGYTKKFKILLEFGMLFLIYINDIPNSSNILNFLMYADDTTLHCCLEDIEDDNKEFRIKQELQHVQDWLKVNRLALNVKKTKYMMFHKHNKIVQHLDLHVNNNAIEKVDNFIF